MPIRYLALLAVSHGRLRLRAIPVLDHSPGGGSPGTVRYATYPAYVISAVVLDAGAVMRCRRRVHLEHDPAAADAPRLPADPATEQRIAHAVAHRRAIAT